MLGPAARAGRPAAECGMAEAETAAETAERLHTLEAQMQCRTKRLIALEESTDRANKLSERTLADGTEVRRSFLTQAFTIVFAFQLGQFCYHTATRGWCGEQCSAGQQTAVRLAWWLANAVCLPLAAMTLKHAEEAKDGAARRTLAQNLLTLTAISWPMVVAWSFKDLIQTALLLRHPPANSYAFQPGPEPSDSLDRRLGYTGFVAVVACVAVLAAVLVRMVGLALARSSFRLHSTAGALTSDCLRRLQRGLLLMIRLGPFQLGLGYVLGFLADCPRRYFLYYGLKHAAAVDDIQFLNTIFQLLQCLLLLSLAVSLAKVGSRHDRKASVAAEQAEALLTERAAELQERGASREAIDQVNGQIWQTRQRKVHGSVLQQLRRMMVGALEFVVAFVIADLLRYQTYFVILVCETSSLGVEPDVVALASRRCSIWSVVYYALAVTTMATVVAPYMHLERQRLLKLDGFLCAQLMTNEAGSVRNVRNSQVLGSKVLGIVVGVSWVDVASIECSSGVSWSCPGEINAVTVIKSAVVLLLYMSACSLAFHMLMERWRLIGRVALVMSLQHGNAENFFRGVDRDNDGNITREELHRFIDSNGLRLKHFEHAFDQVLSGDSFHSEGHTRCKQQQQCLQLHPKALPGLHRMMSMQCDMHDLMEHFEERILASRREWYTAAGSLGYSTDHTPGPRLSSSQGIDIESGCEALLSASGSPDILTPEHLRASNMKG